MLCIFWEGDCLIYIIPVAILIIAYLVYSNKKIVTTEYIVRSERVPTSFEGFRIVNASDFHNRFFGRNSSYLLSEIKKASPDIIVITGDIIDRRNLNIKRSVHFASKAASIAPVYYVTGNHESVMAGFNSLIKGLRKAGVEYIDNRCVTIEREEGCIELMGIPDQALGVEPENYRFEDRCREDITSVSTGSGNFGILLAHRPDFFDIYASNADVVLCGHAHGGQFRIPFKGGLFAPGQGLFPKFTSGRHTKSGTDMIISRGIGNSSFPIRINNNPEIVVVELKKS